MPDLFQQHRSQLCLRGLVLQRIVKLPGCLITRKPLVARQADTYGSVQDVGFHEGVWCSFQSFSILDLCLTDKDTYPLQTWF